MMSPADAEAWLLARAEGVPPRLLARMRSALAGVESDRKTADPISRKLGEAAIVCLRAALPRTGDRSGALDLLAADALLTAGCEAAAEEGPGAVARFAAGYGAARLARLLPGK